MNVSEARSKHLTRIRRAIWVDPLDHVLLSAGPWAYLYCPFNQECNGRDPVQMLAPQLEGPDDWEEYTGALPESEEYKAAKAKFKGCLEDNGEGK